MIEVEISNNAIRKAENYQVVKKLKKQVKFLKEDPMYTSLKFQELKGLPGVWKFRIDLHYWGLTIREGKNKLTVYDVIKHP